ncbi:MAG: cytochrome c [Candidatus Latescibacteria bacterium]|nr:cytochrome c [Candidatus Latescibacterota bacterium]
MKETRPRAGRRPLQVLVAACILGAVSWSAAQAPETQRQRLEVEGKEVYLRHCAGCHGEKGDGKGPAAAMLIVKPRDFTSGIFKFVSTPNGSLPTDEDLYKVITRGLYNTSMPEWSLLSEKERVGVVQYLKTFSPRWQQERPEAPIFVPEPPEWIDSPESVARGAEVYNNLQCAKCHGATGKGDGPSAAPLDPDVWGNPQKPFNFTRGRLKSGPSAKDIYRTFMTGVNGTAMPSYGDIFAEPDGEYIREGDAWHLISYTRSLRK